MLFSDILESNSQRFKIIKHSKVQNIKTTNVLLQFLKSLKYQLEFFKHQKGLSK